MGKFREWLREAESKETIKEENEYQKFFNKKLEKFGVKSPAELSDEDKKKFFSEIENEWEGEKEEKPKADDVNEAKQIDINVLSSIMDKFNKSIQKAIKENKLMEIDSDLHSLKKSIDAWIPVIQDKIKSK